VADGVSNTATQMQCQRTYITTAISRHVDLDLSGETRSAAGAEVQMAIFRTIRIVPRMR
jgi:hypothetical protein